MGKATVAKLPEGFELEQPAPKAQGLPQGFEVEPRAGEKYEQLSPQEKEEWENASLLMKDPALMGSATRGDFNAMAGSEAAKQVGAKSAEPLLLSPTARKSLDTAEAIGAATGGGAGPIGAIARKLGIAAKFAAGTAGTVAADKALGGAISRKLEKLVHALRH